MSAVIVKIFEEEYAKKIGHWWLENDLQRAQIKEIFNLIFQRIITFFEKNKIEIDKCTPDHTVKYVMEEHKHRFETSQIPNKAGFSYSLYKKRDFSENTFHGSFTVLVTIEPHKYKTNEKVVKIELLFEPRAVYIEIGGQKVIESSTDHVVWTIDS